jgi:cytochrome c
MVSRPHCCTAGCVTALLGVVLSTASWATLAQGEGSRGGAALFEARCAACHSLNANRIGPMLGGVVGRKVASVPGYPYSDAIKHLKGTWDRRRLEAWLSNPQAVAPGTKMAFALTDAEERRQVILFLGSARLESRTGKLHWRKQACSI